MAEDKGFARWDAVVRYEPDTGRLIWKRRRAEGFKTQGHCNAWNARFAEREVGAINPKTGYKSTTVGRHGDSQAFLVHRICWLLSHGEWPDKIDHINGNRTDNRFINLRSVTTLENHRNMAMPRANTSGFVGVGWDSERGKWVASLRISGKTKKLGRFSSKEEAIAARQSANRKYGFHPNHGVRSVG